MIWFGFGLCLAGIARPVAEASVTRQGEWLGGGSFVLKNADDALRVLSSAGGLAVAGTAPTVDFNAPFAKEFASDYF